MNYEATIRQLKERSQFYAAAAGALEKIHEHENGVRATTVSAIKAGTKKRRPRIVITDADVQRTMEMTLTDAAKEIGCSLSGISLRRAVLRGKAKANGSAGDPIAAQ